MRYLGICAIIKDETPFLAEWVAYYMRLGVEAFYLYDNRSEIPVAKTLAGFSQLRTNAILSVYDVPGRAMQIPVYNHCLNEHDQACRWLAFIDLDEFVVPKQADSIPELLEEYESHAGLALSWKAFGSNGHKARPKGLQIENYTRAMADDSPKHGLVKSIVTPRAVKLIINPPMCQQKEPDQHVVTEDHEPIAVAERPHPTWAKGQINHYFCRSRQDYVIKSQKPRGSVFEAKKQPESLVPPEGDVLDTSAMHFAPGVKEILKQIYFEES